MPTINIDCPIEGCQYSTGEQEAAIAAALLGIHATSHTSGSSGGSSRPPPVERPKVSAACPKADWLIFKFRWKSFKSAASIDATKIVHQLIGYLDSDLTTLLYNECSAPETLDKMNLLNVIEKVAVKPENIWVTREKLHTMSQDAGEPMTITN